MSISRGASIESFHLSRSPADREPLWIENAMEWMDAEHKDRALWEDMQIEWGRRKISEYTISLPNNAYVVSHINTQDLPRPKMKHRDIIVDNWTAAGGELASLQKIAVTFITNSEAYICIESAFIRLNTHLPPFFLCTHIFIFITSTGTLMQNSDRNSPGWRTLVTGNPFLEGQQKMLREYRQQFNRAKIGKVTVAAHEKSDMIDMYLFNMVTHLVHPSSIPQEDPEPEPEAEQSQPYPSQDYLHQQFPQGIQFSNWNNGRY
ncbi:uncharacterized protein GGS22DRAFT_197507 [Annulohypoxylon maeteangense]|uniref:uncharacterized protein n=1 Tax=Annulohypoxylon maeteangense TaxID=1927788 RepID=UPI002007B928|nr:uncharacterized protein GGS22DRAFT_197507 [Annulohypoxylon maeteangense]KAI0880447.1 hypothetical protein GGS22DRAFT_197507 [Annulohypoxylon maeteangense]